MVVEDDLMFAEQLVAALEKDGYEVTGSASSVDECIAAVGQRRPDLVIMDINLRGPLDGIDATRVLREQFGIPVVFLSGRADDETMRRARLAGAFGYLLKPFRWSELKSAMEVALSRHQLESQLRYRERWLSATLSAIGDAAIALDPEGRITFMNGAAEALLRESEAIVRGRPLDALIRLINENTRDWLHVPLAEAFGSGNIVRLPRNTALIAAGREVPVSFSIAPINDERGEPSGAVAVIKDLTEPRRAQQQVAVSDRLASLGVVTAGIAHEINNPLTYVVGNVEVLVEELARLRCLVAEETPATALDGVRGRLDELDDLVRDLQVGTRHVARIASDLNVFSHGDAREQVCDVVERMQWALRVANSAIVRHAAIQRDFREVPKAAVDGGRLSQVFLNLLLNAAHAMRETPPETNELTVSVKAEDHAAGEPVRFIRIAIADTGIGMSDDVLKRIFEPFFTTKPSGSGTGLGLAVCQSIVTEMGGDISVTSSPGRGSCFMVRVPAALEPESAEEQHHPLVGVHGRVLVIDDDAAVLAVLHRILSARHHVVTRESAERALQLLLTEDFDVLICDLMMPGMNGIAFYSALAARAPDVASRIIFISGGAHAELNGELLSSIPNVVLQKPPDPIELQRVVEQHILRRRQN